jgi:alpha-galactosidase
MERLGQWWPGRSVASGVPSPWTVLAVAVLGGVMLLCAAAAVPANPSGRLSRSTVAIPGVGATPPMGWNTWNGYGCDIDAQIVEQAADALVATGMRDAGYRYVVVDDCWFAPQRTAAGALQADPGRFPQGMPAVADYVHARGLRFGIYESPSAQTCAQLGGTYPGRTGSAGHETIDAKTFAAWGVDYLKYDWCSTDSDLGDQIAAFTTMRDALRATGRPIVYSINPNSGVPDTPPGALYDWSGIATLWRTTNDVYPGWALDQGLAGYQGIGEILSTSGPLSYRGGPGHWLDPDMLEVGVPGVAHTTYPGLSPAEQRTQFGMWSMLAAPLIAGNVLGYMSAPIADLLTNGAVIALDQDPLGAPATAVPGSGEKVWRRILSDGSVAVALWNSGDSAARVEVPLSALHLPPADAYVAENLWNHTYSDAVGAVGAQVQPHDTVLFRITANDTAE